MTERSVNVKLRMDIAEYLASARGASAATRDVNKAARDLRKSLDEEEAAAGRVRVAEARLNEVRADGKAKASQLAAAEEDLARAHRQHETATDRVTESNRRYSESLKQSEQDSERSSKKIGADLEALAKLSLGLPVAAAAGAVATGASLALLGAGFAALGIVGVAKTAEVRDAFGGLKDQVVGDVQAMSQPLQGEVVGAIDQFGNAWTRIRPLVAAAVQGSAPAIEELAGTVTDLAENAMPGMVTAVGRSGPALLGLRAFAAQTGTGISDLFENISQGSAGAQRGLTVFGGTVETLAGRVGTMFANLANGSERPLRSLDVIVNEITAGLVALTAQGSGAFGFLQGFSTAGAGMATVLHGALTALSALPPQVTQFAGSIGAAGFVLGKFGIDAGAGFDGLGGKIKAADGVGGKFKATMGGLAAGALNPAALAAGGLGIALLLMGQDAERADHAAASLAASQRSYTEALRSSKGVLDENVRASVAQDLAQKTINGNSKSLLDFAKQYGVALPQVTSAVMGETGALGEVNRQLDAYAKANPDAATTVHALKAAIAAKGVSFRESTDAVSAEAAATDESAASQSLAREAVNALTQAIFTQQNAQLGYRGAVLNSKSALDEWTKTSKDGKATADEKARALLGVEQAFAAEEQAAYQAAYANSAAKDESGKVADALIAQNRETVNLANSFAGPLPASLQQTIGKMSATQAQAAGLKLGVNNLGQAVYQLPNGKYILIESSADQQAARMQNLRDRIDSIPTRHYTEIEIMTIYKQVGTAATRTGVNSPDVYLYGPHAAAGGPVGLAPRRPLPGYAGGGPVDIRPGGLLRGPGSGTSDSIVGMSSRGMGAFSNGEYVEPADRVTPTTLPILEAIRRGDLRGYSAGGPVQYGTVSQATWDGLYASGWRGNPGDGMEALYAPQSVVAQSSVVQAIQSGNAVQQVPQFSGSYAGGRGSADGIQVQVFVGDREITDIVDTRIKHTNRGIRRSVTTGSGGAR